ncbi:hypothetical protein ACQ7HM_21235 [Williamsia sp. MIQD14]|uniref:hypothetical protein n=1 Tax=Williamsia sp. MIQD14 TaxID=3425703 RepID=UPI003DA0BFEB
MTGEGDDSLRELAKFLVGPAEIAVALGIEANTVNVWKTRHSLFPKPVKRLRAGDLWDIREIEAWAESTGRPVVVAVRRDPQPPTTGN